MKTWKELLEASNTQNPNATPAAELDRIVNGVVEAHRALKEWTKANRSQLNKSYTIQLAWDAERHLREAIPQFKWLQSRTEWNTPPMPVDPRE